MVSRKEYTFGGPIAGRRQVLAGLTASALALPFFPRLSSAASDRLPVRMSKAGPGTAGTVQDDLLTKFPELDPGLDIEWIDGSPGQFQMLLISGALDCGPFGALGIAEAAQKGAELVIFGSRLNNHGSWIVRGDSPYQHPSDLKGKRIATQLPTSDTYRQARMAAALQKLDLEKDFQVSFGPSVSNVALFNRGDVDAVIAIEPVSTQLIAQGHREIARVADQWREATGDNAPLSLVGVSATAKWVDGNTETARRVAQMTLAVNRRFATEPSLIRDPAIQGGMGIKNPSEELLALLEKRLPRVYATEWNEAVINDFNRQLDVAIDLKIIERRPKYSFAKTL
ncbi:ABC transporter substrate-binding protein [Neorhizobium galegae]|uniref:ABC transporter, substrate-binding protein, aliphatic sulfonates family n=2 Tax=Neorhizobium galegae TaxID=399 RepID=A0A068T1M0_NEOGA|nr:PhnD/SsuA/transferrin family substrate-binding protein [Neorhizobium galegae]MCQ1854581.1 PhnD/SsuA/transferrin family substrate-binding protein [Neorhizobium galegae]CDN51936.1 ABC transporter, substrate-binding protein, aliphatic sulfonates family [Neorhizobium galegae bv. orientalis str. HAMBI 540]CDZ51548.1 Alkanesulfonate transporter subunit; periplasmic-binding component of ABC superfamily [Neorhizobium galegae bv. orientalis]